MRAGIVKKSKILIVGHADAIEMSLVRGLYRRGFSSVLSSTELSLNPLDGKALRAFMDRERPEFVILSSVRAGGIAANQAHGAEFMFENLQAQNNVIDFSYRVGVKKLLFLAASCVYPQDCPQPIKEEYFLTGTMEKISEPYSMAKAAGVVMCQAYFKQYGFPAISAVPATVYGPAPERDLEEAHVMGALIGKLRKAAKMGTRHVELWGSGKPRREFIFGDDLTEACLFLLERYHSPELINIGTGIDVEIGELAAVIASIVGYRGQITWDKTRPDGVMRKLLDSSRIKSLGWNAPTGLREGISATCEAGLEEQTFVVKRSLFNLP
ncbi:MAG: NAD-dependent epimerase/dehydratase family protein [Candidatus Omnitrophica bacterium]|nr:NAD-dependent epimerase/dehydratase family protein [Candidatus Omnitrophota bacterium]